MTSKNYVNLTVNPCKMCMPMGAVTALYGIRGCMSILHGSQGCSTYMRRHMATHYNEPVDIASSSLTEQGTVYGGEANLIAGLKNLIRLYAPQVIGISTTCLAETIGEDVPRIIEKIKDEEFCRDVVLLSVATPGYGGTQYEGWFAAVQSAVDALAEKDGPNGAVNLVTGPMSPAEHRELKRLAAAFGLDCILLPDISENLDRVFDPVYKRLPQNGTPVADIRRMGGACCTLELGLFAGRYSPGRTLEQKFGVPCRRLPLPIGLRGTDSLLAAFSEIAGRPVPEWLRKARGRYLDAMVDAHKYCGEGEAAIYGEPDLAYGLARLCLECGVFPPVVACGGKCGELKELLEPEIAQQEAVRLKTGHVILDDTDFEKIGELAAGHGVNLMVGNSDGRRIEEKTGIPLVRVGFPIHDRVGGQRRMTIGYEGSLQLMDEMANLLLGHKERTFRGESYRKYYRGGPQAVPEQAAREEENSTAVSEARVFHQKAAAKSETHPCFNCGAGQYARIHLPVAPACNIQCNYCARRFDCVNESRPGVTSELLSPEEALARYRAAKARVPHLTVVGIAGPGDALANFEQTRQTLAAIRDEDPEVTFCLSTNGLLLPLYADELAALGVSHVTVTVNAADDETGAKVYRHVEYEGRRYTGREGAALLRRNQLEGIRRVAARGIVVKVNIVLLKGVNDGQIGQIIEAVKGCGASIANIMKLIPVPGTPFENLPAVSNQEIMAAREKYKELLPQMTHCRQCRADAVGRLSQDVSYQFRGPGTLPAAESRPETPGSMQVKEEGSLRFAVCSKSGMLVDEHFGHAREFYIYDCADGRVRYRGKREISRYCAPEEDCGSDRPPVMDEIRRAAADCDAVLCMRIGVEPARQLRESGKVVLMTYDRIESAVSAAADQMARQDVSDIYVRRPR